MKKPRVQLSIVVLGACVTLAAMVQGADQPLGSGIDKANFDTSVKPGDDFFEYVNGTWNKNNPIPPEYTRWGAFPKLADDNLKALHEILENLTSQSRSLSDNERKLRDFYTTAMDEAKIQQQGASPLAPQFERIEKVNTPDELVNEIAHLRAEGISMMFGLGVAQDDKQSDRYAVHLRQGGLGLPERSYYLEDSPEFNRIRQQYHEHVAKMLTLMGDSPEQAAKGAEAVFDIEKQLAEASRSPVELRDREKNYNKESLPELSALAPNVKWDRYLAAIDLKDVPYVIVGQPEFFQKLNDMLKSVPMSDWKTYLRWHLIHQTAEFLSDPFEKEDFHFYSEVLRGAKEMQPRWKRTVRHIDQLMGEALGQLYVEKYFPPAAKQRMDELVKNILAVYRDRIMSRDWMTEETKKQALAKLDKFTPKIGYPSKWRDYSALEVGTDSYVQNALRAYAFESHYRLSKLGQPVDRTEWHMTPPTVNAYYNSSMNEIVFPAGILQPPFFNPAADDAVNYGAIGSVIGHEITHGFDDQGSKSDGNGNLHNWWTAEDRAKFNAKTEKLAKQYDACVAVDDLHVNGHLTLGENIADLGGIAISYAAYQKSLNGKPAPVIDGLTGPQRFFIGFAQVWRGESRDAEQRLRIRTDPHSPPRFRVLVPLSNIQAFYDAFDVKPGDRMYRPPEDRVEVW